MKINIAAAQYPIDFLSDWQSFQQKIHYWVETALQEDARLLVFPEYAGMELASLFEAPIYRSLGKQLPALQTLLPDYLQLFSKLAKQHRLVIVAGSLPVRIDTGHYRNRAYIFFADGDYDFQEKIQMTRFESEYWNIQAGDSLKVFDADFGCFAVNICYDSEFPLIARQQAEAGADFLLVPSCTDSLAGYNRVKIGCRARALENQFYVIQSPTVGNAPWSEAVDINTGAAGVYSPVDEGFPDDGILAQGPLNAAQWVYAELDLQRSASIRKQGKVFNYRDWESQRNCTLNVDC